MEYENAFSKKPEKKTEHQNIDNNDNENDADQNIHYTINQLNQLFARITQDVKEEKPKNVIHFIVDFLCKNYSEHLKGFAAVWNGDPELDRERLYVVEFFKSQKLPTEIASHFTNAGFDTLETLCTLTSESLDDIERFNQTRWLPGHKVRLQQTFSDIATRVKTYREEKDSIVRAFQKLQFCHHPTAIVKPNLVPSLIPVYEKSKPAKSCCFTSDNSLQNASYSYPVSYTNYLPSEKFAEGPIEGTGTSRSQAFW